MVNACKEVSFDRNEGVPLAFSVCIQRGPARNRASILRFLDDQFMSMGDSMMTAEFALEGDQPIMAAMMVEGLLALTHELGDWLK